MFQNPHQQIIHHLLLSHLTLGYTILKRHNWLTWKSINQDSVYLWWGTSQRESPGHVPVYILGTKESLRKLTPYTCMGERSMQCIWQIVQILWEPDYSDRQAGECNVQWSIVWHMSRTGAERGGVRASDRKDSQSVIGSSRSTSKRRSTSGLRHCSWISHTSHLTALFIISHTSHLTALFMDITHFTPYGTVHGYHTLHTLRHCSWISHTSHLTTLFISHTSHLTAQTSPNILVTSQFK